MSFQYFKGMPRPYHEADNLEVIDQDISSLVRSMNHGNIISTNGSCQGHGLFFISVPPYVSFKAAPSVAAEISRVLYKKQLEQEFKFNFYWEINGKFNNQSEFNYILSAPSISTNKWFYATRRKLLHDFSLLTQVMQEIFNHLPC